MQKLPPTSPTSLPFLPPSLSPSLAHIPPSSTSASVSLSLPGPHPQIYATVSTVGLCAEVKAYFGRSILNSRHISLTTESCSPIMFAASTDAAAE